MAQPPSELEVAALRRIEDASSEAATEGMPVLVVGGRKLDGQWRAMSVSTTTDPQTTVSILEDALDFAKRTRDGSTSL